MTPAGDSTGDEGPAGGRILMSGRRALSAEARAALRRVLSGALREGGREGSVSIVFTGDDEIRALHRDFLGEDSATDVITFPLDDDGEGTVEGHQASDDLLGEIVVSVDTARREAARRDLPLDRELSLYAIHGVLHLLGFDDHDVADRRRMRRAERRLLDRL